MNTSLTFPSYLIVTGAISSSSSLTKKRQLTDLQNDNIARDEIILQLQREMKNKEERIEQLEDTIKAINEKLNALDRTKDDTVSAYYCASKDFWGTDNSIIPYDKLLTSEVFEVPGGGLNIATGEFTATFSGVWEVTWSMRTQHKARDDTNTVHLDRDRVPQL